MKSFIIYLIVISSVLFFLVKTNPLVLDKINQFIYPPCSQPIEYNLGLIDPKFNITRAEFRDDIDQAAQIWNNGEGRVLFKYNPKAKLEVNLVYDQRQSLISEVNKLESKLTEDKNRIKPSEQKYQNMVSEFNTRLNNLNSEIKFWNEHGGARPDEYQKLVEEQRSLEGEAANLNQLAKDLNKSASDYNLQVGELNDTADNLNNAIQNKPEEGLYDPSSSKIDIYLIINQNELIHTLAHELGHSLGLKHLISPKSIMYPYTTKDITLSSEDIAAVKSICKD